MIHKGISLAAGVAVGRAFRLEPGWGPHTAEPVKPEEVAIEIARFEEACQAAEKDLQATAKQTEKAAGPKEAEIFRAHHALVRDPFFVSRVRSLITENHWSAERSVRHILDEFEAILKRMSSGNHAERVVDLRDVLGRILGHLHGRPEQRVPEGEPVVLVALEFLPSFAYLLDRDNVVALVTETGGATSHGAILARALGIPAVSGVRGLLGHIQENDLLAVDGREGRVHLNPGPERVAAFRKLNREYHDIKSRLIENRDLQPINPEGVRCELLANVNSAADARMACQVGADGVGLYRTEYLFLNLGHLPDEEEQYQTYREVVESSPNKRVTIRTIDVGGDKQLPLLSVPGEANPFMGFRSIRMVKQHPEFFRTQIRAILRAAAHGDVSLLFPMISRVEEVVYLRRFLDDTIGKLSNDGLAFQADIPVGIMIEVPSVALGLSKFLDLVDFVSIGSNDLIQYMMAADRDNPRVAHLCEPFNPTVYALISRILDECAKHTKRVTICGEMAGLPRCFLPLFGYGMRSFSMSPALLPTIKETLRRLPLRRAQAIGRKVKRLISVKATRNYLSRQALEIWPEVKMVDVRR
jgi:phosphotransferase system enzyme I (PtsI)